MDRFSLININDHPTNPNKKVFYFKSHEHANYFEVLLIENKVEYEKQIDEEGDQTIYFGVRNAQYKLAMKYNYLTHGKFRNKFIPDRFFRYLLIIVSILVVSLSIIGAILSQ